jgi:hypothetical protein
LIYELRDFAYALNEIHWSDRLHPWNHVPHFPILVTGLLSEFTFLLSKGMVDTFPVHVLQPLDPTLASLLFNPKYGCCVYKFQLGCDFLGRFILFSGTKNLVFLIIAGPHLGTSYDGHIWDATSALHPIRLNEFLLGDGHYIACRAFLTPYRHKPNLLLTDTEYIWNATLARYRARIEHSNRRVKSHAIFQTAWRGSLGLLEACVQITVHTQAVVQNMFIMYELFGPWSHMI